MTRRRSASQPATLPIVFAYIVAVTSHPAFTARFADDMAKPGVRVPITTDADLFAEAAEVGRTVVWLHCFGERFSDAANGRPPSAPRLAPKNAPKIPAGGTIGQSAPCRSGTAIEATDYVIRRGVTIVLHGQRARRFAMSGALRSQAFRPSMGRRRMTFMARQRCLMSTASGALGS